MVQPTGAPLGTEQNPVKLALAPSTETAKVIAAGEPLVSMLEKETGLRVKLSVPTSYAAVIEAMGTHNVDVGWLSPLAYVLAHDRVGADVLVADVRDGGVASVGQIVVRVDSGITSLDGLRNRRFAFADRSSVAGHYLPSALLLARGLDPATAFAETIFADGAGDVLMAVYNRRADGGALRGTGGPAAGSLTTTARTSGRPLPADLAEQLRVVAQTRPVPNDAVGIRKGVTSEISQRIRNGLLQVAATPAGAAALHGLYGIEGFGTVTDADYVSLREVVELLDLDLDAQLGPRRAAGGR